MPFPNVTPKTVTIGLTVSVGMFVAGLYASTLMMTINGCGHEYCIDVGEFQIALALWGTVHYTGYPLYMLLGSPFVALLRIASIPPAMGASLYSLVWETAAVAGLVILLRRWSQNVLLVGGVSLLFAVIEPVWVHGVLAEVYSLSMALTIAILYLTFELHERWSDQRGWVLALLGGLGVAHHRLLALLLIPVGLFLLPKAWRAKSFPRWLLLAGLCFGAGFLPYLDIPLRIALGSTWNYDQANLWQGFWRIFRGTEVAGLQQPQVTLSALLVAAQDIKQTLSTLLTWPGFILMGGAAAYGIWHTSTRWVTGLMVGVAASFILFALVFHDAVLIQASLMGVCLAGCVLLVVGASSLQRAWQTIGGLVCLGWAAWLLTNNWSFVTALTHNPGGIAYTATVEKLEAPSGSVIMAPWGSSYFALAYAQRVEGRMTDWQIVDHRANFKTLTAPTAHRVYTHADTLYVFGVPWWAEALGSPLRVVSAGPQLVMLTSEALAPPTQTGIRLGDHIVLDHWEIKPLGSESLNVVLYWSATDQPTANYSTFAHVSDQEVISKPEDLLAQSDYTAPVYGWYPTSQWIPHEVIREDHLLQGPFERPPKTIVIGMYQQDVNGAFLQLGQVILRQQAGSWIAILPNAPK